MRKHCPNLLGCIPGVVVVCAAVSLVGQAETVGWRTDGTGRYPHAQPPVEWSPTKNVVWKTPMPGPSNSIPVLAGDRLFICAEPCRLLCLDKDTGRILWQKNNSIDELDLPPDLWAKIKAEQAEVARLDKQIGALGREAEVLRKRLRDQQTDKAALAGQLVEIEKQAERLKELKKKFTLAARYTERGKQPTAGYSSPTPVTDGRRVIVAFGNGLVACFDLEGKRLWLKLVEQSTAPFAHSNSPLLINGTVLIHFADLVGLKADDGAELWRLQRPPAHGTPVHARVGDTDVVVTPQGLLVRVKDGALLAEGLGNCGANSPILHGGVAYFVRGSATAVELPLSLTPPVQPRVLWKARIKGGGYWFPSPVLHDGLLYALDDQGILSVLEAKTGRLVYEERLGLAGTHYPSVSVAGNHVYLSSDKGDTVVVKAGPKFEVVATNELEPFRNSLVFEGRRLYVRTHKNLYCIGQ
ncbi:MAG: PQQ-binding-like beta-propeller repeat protein [Gemmataceae bacterium]|nr:PQQ-binding-like beta-propeller repeat protein [Gemmataceae bacterium]